MTLSRKHYQAVADIFRAVNEDNDNLPAHGCDPQFTNGRREATDALLDCLSAYFRSDNPNFDPDRFRKAAQP